MKTILVLTSVVLSLGSFQGQNVTYKHSSTIQPLIDTSYKIEVDDYPVTNKMLEDENNHNDREQISGPVVSEDKVWFLNRSQNQTLVFELYTDYHRLAIYHFTNDDIPSELISQMELYVKVGKWADDLASDELKQKYFKGFLKSPKHIDQKYFRSSKGFELGDTREKAIQIYGNPDVDVNSHGELDEHANSAIEVYDWNFTGDNEVIEDSSGEIKRTSKKPIAQDSFGYQVTMFFRGDRLIAMILFNDIP